MGRHLGFLAEPAASLVHLDCQIPDSHPSAVILGTERSGSGVVVDPGGYVVTVGYVVMGAEDLSVVSNDGGRHKARVVYLDHESGLATVRAEGLQAPAAELMSSKGLQPGDSVVLLASNGEEAVRGTTGFVTDLGPFDAHWEYMLDGAIKSTAMNPGLGGGALLTMDGKVRGVVSLNLNLIGICSLSIPIESFLRSPDPFLGRASDRSRVHRPWLGLFPQPLEKGVLVAGVVPGGPAEESGIESGDVLLSINGEEVTSRREFYEKLWQGHAGDDVTLTVYREKSLETVHVSSRSRADFYG